MQLDTGKSRSTVDPQFAEAARLPQVSRGYRLDDVRLADLSFRVPSARADSLRDISRGLEEPLLVGVGSDVLSQVVLTVDYNERLVLFARAE